MVYLYWFLLLILTTLSSALPAPRRGPGSHTASNGARALSRHRSFAATPSTTPTSKHALTPTLSLTMTPVPELQTAFIPFWVENSLTRVPPISERGTLREAQLSAAQNEHEAFQIVVRAPDDEPLHEVDAHVSDFTGPNGVLPSRYATLYREHFVPVDASSPGAELPPGEWPDALIPFLNPETRQPLRGGRFQAVPFEVAPERNQILYVEIYIPDGTTPGLYKGHVQLVAFGRTATEVPVEVRVRDFALPQGTSMRSKFTGYRETDSVNAYFGISNGDPEYSVVADRFNEFLLEYRITPNTPNGTAPYIDQATGHMDVKYSDGSLRHYFEDLHVTGWTIPFGPDWPWRDPTGADRDKAVTYLSEMADYLATNDWLERSYIELYDEPDSSATYETIRQLADLIHSVRPSYRVLVTEQPVPDDTSWGSLQGAVDIWAPLTSHFDEASASQVQAQGDEVWSYTEGAAAPAWLIDQPLLNLRVVAWTSWRYGQNGLLYWTPWYWEEANPWDTAANYVVPWGTFNGNGCLVYPGDDVGYIHGPVPSLRLEALRDGIEDYEYLHLLSELGQSDTAASEALSIGTSWTSWNTDPTQLEAARDRIAVQIEAATAR